MKRKERARKRGALWPALLVLPWMDVPSGLPGRRVDIWKKKLKDLLQQLHNSGRISVSEMESMVRKINVGDISPDDINEWLQNDK